MDRPGVGDGKLTDNPVQLQRELGLPWGHVGVLPPRRRYSFQHQYDTWQPGQSNATASDYLRTADTSLPANLRTSDGLVENPIGHGV